METGLLPSPSVKPALHVFVRSGPGEDRRNHLLLRDEKVFVDNQMALGEFIWRRDTAMNALVKDNVKAPVRPIKGEKPSAREMFERVMKRYPKTMARLAE